MRDWEEYVRSQLSLPQLARGPEARIVRELATQLEDFFEEAIARGVSAPDADAYARGQITDWTRLAQDISHADRSRARLPVHRRAERIVEEDQTKAWRWAALGDVLQDLRYARRRLASRPGFTLVAILTLALGIGANTAIFSVVHGVLLRPLPYPDSGRLAVLTQRQGTSEVFPQLAYLDFTDIREQSQEFESLAAVLIHQFVVQQPDGPAPVNSLRVSPGFFATLGVQPALGRDFLGEEDQEGLNRVAVVSDRFWHQQLSGDHGAIGGSLTLDGESYTVVGVLPADFDFRMPLSSSVSIEDVDVYTPLSPSVPVARNRAVFTFEVIGRLKSQVDWSQAQSGLDTIATRLESAYPETNTGRRFGMVSLHDQVVGRVRPALLVLLTATGLVLLMACTNLGSLLLAQATARRQELTIRAALGAGRGRIIRQLTVESLLLATLGGSAGVLLAAWAKQTLLRLPGARIPRVDEIAVDTTVLGFAIALTVITALLGGLVQVTCLGGARARAGPGDAGRTTAGRFTARLRSALVAAEVAVACVLLVGSILLLTSLVRVLGVHPGFEAERVLTMRVALTGQRYETPQHVSATYRELATRVAALPRVQRIALAGSLPLSGHNTGSSLWIEGRLLAAGQQPPSVRWQTVLPGYFRTMGIPLIRGRDFTEADQERSAHQTIISASLARAQFPGEDPIGKRVYYGPQQEAPDWHEIVGIVGDVRHGDLEEPPAPRAYDLYGQHNGLSLFVVIRTAGDPGVVTSAVRNIVQDLDPEAPVHSIATMEELRSRATAPRHYLSLLVGCFAALALLLAVVGIYGVLTESVQRRTREIGIRVALGARPRDVGRLVVGEGVGLTFIGLVVGLGVTLGLGRFLETLLYGVSSTDVRTYTVVMGAVTLVALLACWVPARRAMRADPIIAFAERVKKGAN